MHSYGLRDAIHTHFVTLIGKWSISFLPIHPVFLSAFSKDVTKLLYFDLPTLPRLSARCFTHPPIIVHLPISVTKWVWMASPTGICHTTSVLFGKFLVSVGAANLKQIRHRLQIMMRLWRILLYNLWHRIPGAIITIYLCQWIEPISDHVDEKLK